MYGFTVAGAALLGPSGGCLQRRGSRCRTPPRALTTRTDGGVFGAGAASRCLRSGNGTHLATQERRWRAQCTRESEENAEIARSASARHVSLSLSFPPRSPSTSRGCPCWSSRGHVGERGRFVLRAHASDDQNHGTAGGVQQQQPEESNNFFGCKSDDDEGGGGGGGGGGSLSIVRSVSSVGFVTLMCKILGLAREVIIAASFGVGWVSLSYCLSLPSLPLAPNRQPAVKMNPAKHNININKTPSLPLPFCFCFVSFFRL